jgi:hypothetical protein
VSDVTLVLAAWIAAAAVVYLAVLPLAFRRRETAQIQTAWDGGAIRNAA